MWFLWDFLPRRHAWGSSLDLKEWHMLINNPVLKDRILTENVLAKNNRFSKDMNPAPLVISDIIGIRKQGIQSWKWKIPKKKKKKKKVMWQKNNLKSVDGSLPCHPISFHCSDTKSCNSFLGNAAYHRALRASYPRKDLTSVVVHIKHASRRLLSWQRSKVISKNLILCWLCYMPSPWDIMYCVE